MTKFEEWIRTFYDEKGVEEREYFFTEKGLATFTNFDVLEFIINDLPSDQQAKIKHTFVMIDFKNGDVYHYQEHLARAYYEAVVVPSLQALKPIFGEIIGE